MGTTIDEGFLECRVGRGPENPPWPLDAPNSEVAN